MRTRILHFTTDSRIGGAEQVLLGLAEKHDRAKYELMVCTLRREDELHRHMRCLGVPAFSLGAESVWNFPTCLAKLCRLLRSRRVDVVHTHLFHASFVGQLAAKMTRVPGAVLTRHYSDYMYLYGNPLSRFLDRLSVLMADVVVAISDAVRLVLVQQEQADPRKVVVVYNGLDLARVPSPPKAETIALKLDLLGRDCPVVGSVGSLHPRKGHEYFLAAAAEVLKQHPEVKFLVVGDGQLRGHLMTLAADLGVAENVVFAGFRPDVPQVIGLMNIFVQPSVEEGFGISILEAMAMGKPVVATRVGGIPEIVDHGITGVLVDPRDAQPLAQAILELLNDKSTARRMGVAGSKRVAEEFRIEAMVARYQEIYDRLLAATKKAPW